jgi:hypothetical protein
MEAIFKVGEACLFNIVFLFCFSCKSNSVLMTVTRHKQCRHVRW